MHDQNKQLAKRWFEEVWNQGRDGAIDELLSPEGVGFGLAEAGTEVHGPEQFRPFVRNFRDAFPDLRVIVEDMVAEADKVAIRFRVTGTTIIQFANGMLVHGWNNWDQLGMMEQLGLTPGSVKVDQFLEKRV